jgi:hypothetical protein
MMKSRGLIVAGVVLAVLTGVLYWSNHHKPAEAKETSADTPPKILSLNEADITKVDIQKKGESAVDLSRNSSGQWQITAPTPLGADQSSVSGVLSSLSSLNSDRLVEEKTSNLDQYGLAQPGLVISLGEKNNRTDKLLIGDDTPTGNDAYAKLDGDGRVFMIASYTRKSLDKGVNDLRDKRLLTVDSDKISRVELVGKQQDLEFGRDKDQWQILKPKPLRADGYQVDELVRKLTDARMDLSAASDAKKTAAAFAAGAPVATAKVTTASGTQQLEVRKNKDDFYAKSSAVDGIFKVTSDLGQGLDKKLDDFRNKKLFDFGYNDPTKVEIHDGSTAYFLTRGGQDWWSADGKKLDRTGADEVVDKVRDLQASKFADTGFTTPAVDVTVTSNDGKRVEKVLIAKAGSGYLAKRDNEPALYVLDTSAVDDLRKSAGDLKPAPPTKTTKK